ncbi:MAG TPA: hypothetical protein VLJ80_01810 [Solirubrobacteraceae bacterium]|nr:hypothetical protein [Solirubrobacteraceae bacterium]
MLASATDRAALHCHVRRCTTLAQNPKARIVQEAPRSSYEIGETRTLAQWLPNGRTTKLGDGQEFGPVIGPVALAGHFLAYALFYFGRYNDQGTDWKVVRLNVKTGHREEANRSGSVGECTGGLAFHVPIPGVHKVVVTDMGAVAWLMQGRNDPQTGRLDPHDYRICALASNSRTPVVLASGSTIAPQSLAASERYVYWTEGGVPRGVPIE